MPDQIDARTPDPMFEGINDRRSLEELPVTDTELPPGVAVDRRRLARQPICILVVIGSRAEAIRMVPVLLAMRDHPGLQAILVTSGQQRDLVEPILADAGTAIDADLGCGREDTARNELVAAVMTRFDAVVRERFGDPDAADPDLQRVMSDGYPAGVLLHGDSSAAMATAVAASHLHIPVVAVDAGRRSPSTTAPSPAEMNHRLVSQIACFHLASTTRSGERLVREGVAYDRVYVCGDTGIDAVRWAASQRRQPADPAVAAVLGSPHPLVVVTAHRRGHEEGALDRVATAVATLAERRPDTRFVVPMHPDPRVRREVIPHLGDRPNVVLTETMDYAAFAHLLARADLVLTDSGPIQEEAPAVGTAVLVTCEATDRNEGEEVGTLRLVGTDPAGIVDWSERLLDDTPERRAMLAAGNPYGDGRSGERIADALRYLAGDDRISPEQFGSGFSRRAVLHAAGYPSPRGTHAPTDPGRAATAGADRPGAHRVGV